MSELRSLKKLLIANRGEIALRVMRTAKKMGLLTVAVYTDADHLSPHVNFADQSVNIGKGPIAESYLSTEKIMEVALNTGCDAVHPGYGFLSENSDFAEACEKAKVIFVGPSSKAIEAMGNKAKAKAIMKEAGVPCIPGAEVENKNDRELQLAAESVGFPLMIKAAAGGGGRGMRLVNNISDLQKNCEIAKAEALGAFGSSEIILEKSIVEPRHIEIQIMADNFGNIISLGERDCSVQRRHQKIIEESPSPVVDAQLRTKMGEVACLAGRVINYSGAGTIEFLLDKEKNFYFLEMNTRLQVEHPVTEMVTGLDLVELQLKVADDQELSLSQEQVQLSGHSLEVRLYSEDPLKNFLPSTGKIEVWRKHQAPYTRYDDGIIEGQVISPFYDPMIAKVISYGKNREQAIDELKKSLEKTALFGVKNNRDFLIAILSSNAFKYEDVNTSFLENNDFSVSGNEHTKLDEVAILSALLMTKYSERLIDDAQDFENELYGWSNSKAIQYPLSFKSKDEMYSVHIELKKHGVVTVNFEGSKLEVCLNEDHVEINSKKVDLDFIEYRGNRLFVSYEGNSFEAELIKEDLKTEDKDKGGKISAPMHGVIRDLFVSVGDKVKKNQVILILEAMKMQHEIIASTDGEISDIYTKIGEQVSADADLLDINKEGEK